MLALVVAAQVAALADDDRVSIAFFRDATVTTCPSDSAIEDAVRERIGSDPFLTVDDGASRSLRVGLARAHDQLGARVAMFAPSGTRLGVR
ncbi:MAG TPA: hypothetical protein VGO62_08985, partial [Myxococcota bacterium]